MSRQIFKSKSNAEVRDAAMLYVVLILDKEEGISSLEDAELAYLTRVIHSETFLVALQCIKIETGIEDFQFYNLEALRGIKQQPGEDVETLGDKLVDWVNETLEEYREPLED